MSEFQKAVKNLNKELNLISLSEEENDEENLDLTKDPSFEYREAVWRRSIGMPMSLVLKQTNQPSANDEMLKTEMTLLGIQYPGDLPRKFLEESDDICEESNLFTIKPVQYKTPKKKSSKKEIFDVKAKNTKCGPISISNCDEKFNSTQKSSQMTENSYIIPPCYRYHYGEPPPTSFNVDTDFEDFEKIFDDLNFVETDIGNEINLKDDEVQNGNSLMKDTIPNRKKPETNKSTLNRNAKQRKSQTRVMLNLAKPSEGETEVTVKVKISDETCKKQKKGKGRKIFKKCY